MSILDDLKAAWNKEYEENEDPTDKVTTLVVAAIFTVSGLFVMLLLLSLVWLLVKAAFPFIVGGVVVYGLGAYFLGWPLPSVLKKLIRK